MTSASGPPWAEEAGVHRAGQQDMEARMHGVGSKRRRPRLGCHTGIQPPLTTMAMPLAAVRARRRSARQRPVGQQHGRKQHVRDQDQPHPHGFRTLPAARAASSLFQSAPRPR